MATNGKSRNNSSKGTSPRSFAQQGSFVRCELDETAKKHLSTAPYDPARMFEWQMAMVQKGYKISVSLDDKGGGCLASAYDKSASDAHRGSTLTARGKDMHNALLALAYKHDHIMSGIWFSEDEIFSEWG